MNLNKLIFDRFLQENAENVDFCFMGGSNVKDQDNNNSDIDMFICVDQKTPHLLLNFNEFYFDLHRRYFKKPDLEYPGEIMSFDNLINSIKLCLQETPSVHINNPAIYDGLVWSGMLVDEQSNFWGDTRKYINAQKLASEVINKWYSNLAPHKELNISSKVHFLKKNIKYGIILDAKYLDEVKKRAKRYADTLIQNKSRVKNLLLDFESYETFIDEYTKSIAALKNIDTEFKQFPKANTRIVSAFLPLNLPLYSLVLFSLIPSLYSEHVFLRPPTILSQLYKELIELLNIDKSAISLCTEDRNVFVAKYAKNSNVVIFVGKYENALNLVKNLYKETLFIYTGYGINPILVLKNADLDKAVKDTIKVKIFNNGQDCAGADAIIIPEKYQDIFVEKLKSGLKNIVIGKYTNKKVRIGPMLDDENLYDTVHILKKYRNKFVYGGVIDFKQKIIKPTIIVQSVDEELSFEEFYSPIFKVITYKKYSHLSKFFTHTNYIQNRMYISLYGKIKKPLNFLNENIILENKTIHDHEKGNFEYGGYGKHANFVSINRNFYSKPILISQEISNYLKNDDR